MSTETSLLTAINNRDFTKAKTLLIAGEIIPNDLSDFNLAQIYESIIKDKGFSFLEALVDSGKINCDVYEYDSFNRSIFEIIFKNLSADEEALNFLSNFISKLKNTNDEVKGATLLSFAFEQYADPLIIKCLIDSGCHVDFKDTAENNLIIQVIRINIMPVEKQLAYLEILIQNGVDVNEQNVEKKTALHIVVEYNKIELIDILLANGARSNVQDWNGNTPFYYALVDKSDDIIYTKLSSIERPDFIQKNLEDETILSAYMKRMSGGAEDIIMLGKLIDDDADMEQTSRYYSEQKSGWDWALEKPLPVLQMLLTKTGADINMQDNNGNTLLHKVCAIDSNFSQEAAKETYKKVKLLLDAGADASITNNMDKTAMMIASSDNFKTKTVELLLTSKG